VVGADAAVVVSALAQGLWQELVGVHGWSPQVPWV
jgi:hypothetical protein